MWKLWNSALRVVKSCGFYIFPLIATFSDFLHIMEVNESSKWNSHKDTAEDALPPPSYPGLQIHRIKGASRDVAQKRLRDAEEWDMPMDLSIP